MNTMTPIQAQVLLHCYYACESYPTDTPAVEGAYKWLTELGLIALVMEGKEYQYHTTARGDATVEAVRAIPLPEQTWVIPEREESDA